MLPFVYPGQDVKEILSDIESASIPETHKLMFNWIRGFTQNSANLTSAEIDCLRQGGINDQEIVEWANVAATQTWFVMSADGGGIPLEGGAVVGSVIGKERSYYHNCAAKTLSSIESSVSLNDTCYVETDAADVQEIEPWAQQRYGFVPNLFKAVSLSPDYNPRHQLAMELLDGPQSGSLSPAQHAMVRRLVNRLNRGTYFDRTTSKLLKMYAPGINLDNCDLTKCDGQDRVVLEFAEKILKNSYKVTAKDAAGFRECGLDDEAYVDVINTVSIQTSLDRLCNALGVMADEMPLIWKKGKAIKRGAIHA